MFQYLTFLLVTILPIVLWRTLPGVSASNNGPKSVKKDYCVIGAGPGGLQMGYFLQHAGRDYVIFERANISGAFFVRYPRHRKLISINKRHTGKTNKEFNLRHDWNSLLSDDESLQMRHYSKEFFPDADDYVRYLNDYAKKLNLNIQYKTNIGNIQRVANVTNINKTDHFTMEDQLGQIYKCRYLIISTGISIPNTPNLVGIEHTESYEDISMDRDDYEAQSVLILGRGNSAFETADHIIGNTNVIHMISRSRVRLAWETHYVGDLRAVNNGLLDTYMLKSLDGLLEGDVSDMIVIKRNDGKLILGLPEDLREFRHQMKQKDGEVFNASSHYHPYDKDTVETDDFAVPDNFALREPYDRIIRCLGFKFDFDIFNSETNVTAGRGRKAKYPSIKPNYESASVPGLFFAGTNTHSVDFRKSAGGFIHGFRYTARALHNILEVRNHGNPWPSVRQPITELLNHIIKRVNEASGSYQMFEVLGDVVILRNNDTEYEYLEEYPMKLLHLLPDVTGETVTGRVFVISLEYGHDFSGPGKDVFRRDRAIGDPSEAHHANFLHPVIYFYDKLPTVEEMRSGHSKHEILPEPTKLHHTVEDFLTDFSAPVSHVLVLRRFLESCIQQDLRNYFDHQCFWLTLTHNAPPLSCQEHFLSGQGLPAYGELVGLLSRKQYFGDEEDTRQTLPDDVLSETQPLWVDGRSDL